MIKARIPYAVNMAVRFLEENKIRSLPFDVFEIIKKYEWRLQKYSVLARMDDYAYTIKEYCDLVGSDCGYSILNKGVYMIAYNDSIESFERTRFTLCHEIGHCYLGHFTEYGQRELSKEDIRALDAQANAFARNLLMPPNVYSALKSPNPLKHAAIFSVSRAAFNVRRQTVQNDLSMLTEESKEVLGTLFSHFIYGCVCKKCRKRFDDFNKIGICPKCGSSDLIWARFGEISKNRDLSKSYYNKVKSCPCLSSFSEGPMYKPREQRIQEAERQQRILEAQIQRESFFYTKFHKECDSFDPQGLIDNAMLDRKLVTDDVGMFNFPRKTYERRNEKKKSHRCGNGKRTWSQPESHRTDPQ